MKKLLTLLVFTFALALGTQDSQAQNTAKVYENPEAEAKKKVSEVNDAIGLTGEQQTALFRAYIAKDYNYNKHLKGLDTNSAEYKSKKAEYDRAFNENAQRALTAEKFEEFMEFQKNKK